jgi:hypothetical protein
MVCADGITTLIEKFLDFSDISSPPLTYGAILVFQILPHRNKRK